MSLLEQSGWRVLGLGWYVIHSSTGGHASMVGQVELHQQHIAQSSVHGNDVAPMIKLAMPLSLTPTLSRWERELSRAPLKIQVSKQDKA